MSNYRLAASAELSDSATDTSADQNSLVLGDLSALAWVVSASELAPATRPLAGDDATTGLRSRVLVGTDGYCPPGGYLERPVTIPSGVTGVVIELDQVELPAGAVAQAFALQLLDHAGTNVMGSASVTPTGTATDATTTEIAVTPGAEYRVRVACNVSAAATFLCGKLRLRPTSYTDPFWGSFRRLDLYGAILDTNETAWLDPRRPPQNASSYVELVTNAREVRVETRCTSLAYLGASRVHLTPTVDGYPITPLAPTLDGATEYLAATIPSAAGLRTVRFPAGMSAASGFAAPVTEERGTWPAALYVPLGAYARLTPAPVEVCVLYGDSKEVGSYSEDTGRDALAHQLRRHHWRVINQATGGGAIYNDVGSTVSVAACTALAMKIARHRPTKVHLQMGRNDWTGSTYTAANLVTQIGNLADAIHAASPATTVVLATWTSEGTEADIGGVSWDTERANIRALAASRSPWCVVQDSARYWTPAEQATFTADTVHPNSLGQERIARGLLGYQHPWSPLQLTPTVWCESVAPSSLVAGAWGAVIALGGGPTLAVTGTPPLASRLLVRISTGGTLGNAKFDASLDGGRSWPWRGVATGASVEIKADATTIAVLAFDAGSYTTSHGYYCDAAVAQWSDLSGNGNHLVQATAGARLAYVPSAMGGRAGLLSASGKKLGVTLAAIPKPYTVALACQCTNGAHALQGVLGSETNTGITIYSSSTIMYAYGNVTPTQISVTTSRLLAHSLIVVAKDAASTFYVDGTATTGSLGADVGDLTSVVVGQSPARVAEYWDGWVADLIVVPREITSSEALAITARHRAIYGTQ